jgi:hypothetical protein
MGLLVYKIEPHEVFAIRPTTMAGDNQHSDSMDSAGSHDSERIDRELNDAKERIQSNEFDSAANLLFELILSTGEPRAYELLRPIVSKTHEWSPSDEEWLSLVRSSAERGDAFQLMAAVSVFTRRSLRGVWEIVVPTLTDQEVRIHGEEIAIALRLENLRPWGERIEMWQSYSSGRNDKLLSDTLDEQVNRWIQTYKANPSRKNWLPLHELIFAYARLGRTQDLRRFISVYSTKSASNIEWLQLSGFLAMIERNFDEAERLFKESWINADVTALPKIIEALLVQEKGGEAVRVFQNHTRILHGYPKMATDVLGILSVYPDQIAGRKLFLEYLTTMDFGAVLNNPQSLPQFLEAWRAYNLTTEEVFSARGK